MNRKSVVFRPRGTLAGYMSSLVIVTVPGSLFFLLPTDNPASLTAKALCLLAAIIGLFFIAILPTMRYTVTDKVLTLRCGPFRWIIKLEEIDEITRTSLKYHPTSTGWKLPGYALFAVYYADRGNVTMCATRMYRDVLLIRVGSRHYGITPVNIDSFIGSISR